MFVVFGGMDWVVVFDCSRSCDIGKKLLCGFVIKRLCFRKNVEEWNVVKVRVFFVVSCGVVWVKV